MIGYSMEARFSMRRTLLLLRNRFFDESSIIILGAGLFLGINLIALVLGGIVPFNRPIAQGTELLSVWTLSIVLFGLVLASRSLVDMHGSGATEWLLLPASGAEKYAATLIWILVVWPVVGALGATALSAGLAGIASLAGAQPGAIWHPFAPRIALAWAEYLAFAPIFIAGSAFWKRNPLIKTLGVIIGTGLAVVLTGFLALAALRSRQWVGSFSFDNGVFRNEGIPKLEPYAPLIQGIANAWHWFLLPGFALAFAGFRIAEKEARDEVQ